MKRMNGEASIVALPTYYNGVRFKSALEARWAMYFDLIDIEWRYEDEGYSLPSGPYLPDFWLPVAGMHAEVKPETGFSLLEVTRCLDLFDMTRKPVMLLDGWPRACPFYVISANMLPNSRFGDKNGGYFSGQEGGFETISVGTNKRRLQEGCGYWVEDWYANLPYGSKWRAMRPDPNQYCMEDAHEQVRTARRTVDGRLVPA